MIKTLLLSIFIISHYDADFPCTGKSAKHPLYGITFSGARVAPGVVACPPFLPIGTMIFIKEWGIKIPYFCLDRGAAIQGHRLDIYVPTHEEAMRRGIRHAEVEVVR